MPLSLCYQCMAFMSIRKRLVDPILHGYQSGTCCSMLDDNMTMGKGCSCVTHANCSDEHVVPRRLLVVPHWQCVSGTTFACDSLVRAVPCIMLVQHCEPCSASSGGCKERLSMADNAVLTSCTGQLSSNNHRQMSCQKLYCSAHHPVTRFLTCIQGRLRHFEET